MTTIQISTGEINTTIVKPVSETGLTVEVTGFLWRILNFFILNKTESAFYVV